MTRIYRHPVNGITWIERGTNVPVLVLPDHGEPLWRWQTPEPSTLIYDDELHAVENETIDAERERLRTGLVTAVAGSDIAATAKATVRKIIGEVFGPP